MSNFHNIQERRNPIQICERMGSFISKIFAWNIFFQQWISTIPEINFILQIPEINFILQIFQSLF